MKKNIKLTAFVAVVLFAILSVQTAFAATLDVTTKYTLTGGIKGPLNTTGDLINDVPVCPADPTPGCDFDADPGYNSNGTIQDSSDDFYTGDLVVRTNDLFQVVSAWSWSGVKDGPEEEVTIIGTLPATGEFVWPDIPGSCDQGLSSLSADKLTMTCVRNNFTNTGTHSEDLEFAVRVQGDAVAGATPGDISFEVSSLNAPTISDDTDNTSLTVTASPRWNLQKELYTAVTGQTYDHDNDVNTPEIPGYILDYKFYIETDEVTGTTDTTYSLLGNESMGENATFTFRDDFSGISPNAQLIECSMDGRYRYRDGYVGSGDPMTFSGPGSIYGNGVNSDRKIPQPQGEQQISCVENGTDINVTLTGVDATLNNYPTKTYLGNDLPVNRAIAAIGSIYIFVPLTDVEAGPDGISGNADDGELPTVNRLRDFDPTTPAGNSNFGNNTEALNDNDRATTLYGTRGSFSKYYRGEQAGVWTYPGGAASAYSGDGLVTAGYEFSTVLVNNNTGGTAYTEDMCDVVDAYRLEIQDIEDNTIYNTIKTSYPNAYHDDTSPVMYRVTGGSGDYSAGQAVGPYEFEYSSQYVDNSWLPSRGGDQTINHKTEVETECNQVGVWHTTADAARADAAGIGSVTKMRIKLREGVTHDAGAYTYFWLNHKIRTNDLLTGAPLVNGDEITNFAAYSFNGAPFTGPTYITNQYPDTASGHNGDRVTFSGGKVRIIKTSDIAAVAPGVTVEFTLTSSYTNDTGAVESGSVIVRDILPKGFSYTAGTTTGASEPVIGTCADMDASLTCDDNDNTVLIWDLGIIQANAGITPISYQTLIGSSAPAGAVLNVSTIASPSDASALSQRKSEVGLVISVPSTLNIVKSTVDVGLRERTTTGQNIDFNIDMRNGKPSILTNLDVIDILPFIGDGVAGAMQFSAGVTQRDTNTNFNGTSEFVSMNLVQHPESSALCDITANGGVSYYYTDADPTTINMAPSVSVENILGGAQSIWTLGTANTPPAGMTKSDVTAVRAFGPALAADAICQLQLKIDVNNNLPGDVYSNSAGAAITGVTLPVQSNSPSVNIVGASLGNKVWIDTNTDGIQDAGEQGLENVEVHLLDASGLPVNNLATGLPYILNTDAQGEYLFEDLDSGNYKVKFVIPAQYRISPVDSGANDTIDSDISNITTGETDVIILAVGEDNETVDAGVYIPATIEGTVWSDDNKDGIRDIAETQNISGMTVALLDGNGDPVNNPLTGQPYTTTTDVNGDYIFENLPVGDYQVEFNTNGYEVSPQDVDADDTVDSDIDLITFRTGIISLLVGDASVNNDAGVKKIKSTGGPSISYVCKDVNATNYSSFGRHKKSLCEYDEESHVEPEEIEGESDVPVISGTCDVRHITKDIIPGENNSISEVKKLQNFLNKFENENIIIDGNYGTTTVAAINRYQQKYSRDILYPWRLTAPTGTVQSTTRGHINKRFREACSEPLQCSEPFTTHLNTGSTGESVKQVQTFLKELGFYKGLINGQYDSATTEAVRSFQNENYVDVLKPWGIPCQCGTGYWYQTTMAFANKLKGCDGTLPKLNHGDPLQCVIDKFPGQYQKTKKVIENQSNKKLEIQKNDFSENLEKLNNTVKEYNSDTLVERLYEKPITTAPVKIIKKKGFWSWLGL
ncbi:MAG: peptidoglycan-binding protein [Candidatus Pacebacteria bacterium]|nr:peptidoglycan-binding protein [Candidatus Paceibacterota bacterium]